MIIVPGTRLVYLFLKFCSAYYCCLYFEFCGEAYRTLNCRGNSKRCVKTYEYWRDNHISCQKPFAGKLRIMIDKHCNLINSFQTCSGFLEAASLLISCHGLCCSQLDGSNPYFNWTHTINTVLVIRTVEFMLFYFCSVIGSVSSFLIFCRNTDLPNIC